MNVLIIEDETAAAVNLKSILRSVLPDCNVIDILESIEESVDFFNDKSKPVPDLVFMDIHLADGESFRIFDSVDVKAPIIFTTAYDEYALRAFKVNINTSFTNNNWINTVIQVHSSARSGLDAHL